MSSSDRRQFLKGVLATLAQASGSVVLASTAVSAARARGQRPEGSESPPNDLRERADRLTAAADPEEFPTEPVAFLNGGFRNGGGWRNGGFRNGGFRNGGFRNGGWANGGFRNGGFRNGGWRNGGWRNWW